jgi:hypothetical protein
MIAEVTILATRKSQQIEKVGYADDDFEAVEYHYYLRHGLDWRIEAIHDNLDDLDAPRSLVERAKAREAANGTDLH